MTDRLILAAIAVVGVPAALVGYVTLIEGFLGLIPERPRTKLRPWLWLAPALAFLLVFLVYPTIRTVILSFYGPNSERFVGLANYAYVFTDGTMLMALRNNAIWLLLFTLLTVALGLVIAVLTDRVEYEAVAKAIVFLPMAISLVAAGVIWKFMYDFRPPGTPQTGTVNAALTALLPDFQPQAWLINQPVNNFALIVAAVWVWTGFCMVILSAGLKGVPSEILEAARVDGAQEWQVFWLVIVPMLGSTIAVVTTTMMIMALKAFEIVYVTTNGNFDTEVIANRMYKELYNVRDFGRASAVAVVLLAAIVPVMLFNLRRFREQEAMR
jgi:alpha-glucoside transport system permease protein